MINLLNPHACTHPVSKRKEKEKVKTPALQFFPYDCHRGYFENALVNFCIWTGSTVLSEGKTNDSNIITKNGHNFRTLVYRCIVCKSGLLFPLTTVSSSSLLFAFLKYHYLTTASGLIQDTFCLDFTVISFRHTF